ncbi:hypothetical protein [Rhodococcus qingshengii]
MSDTNSDAELEEKLKKMKVDKPYTQEETDAALKRLEEKMNGRR